MIRKLFSGQINSITVAALLVALSSLVSRFLGIFRDRILAGEFGAGPELDVYYAAFRIPDLIFNLLVLGALSAGFVPIFVKLIDNRKEKVKGMLFKYTNRKAWELANNVLNILVLALISFSVIGIIFAPLLIRIITPGFTSANSELTVALTRIMFLSPILLGISSVLGGILQSFKRFFVYSLSPIMYNIGIIIGALYLVPIWGIRGLAWGVVFGALLHMMVQLPAVISLGFKYKPRIYFKGKEIKKIAAMMLPRAMSLAISQINLLVITVIASTLMSGSLAVFNFANNLQSFPIGIFGISFAVAAFPTLSAFGFNKEKLIFNFSNTFRHILFFVIPSTVLLLTLRAQIVRVILGTGQFDWEDTVMTIETLGFFTISLFAQASIPLLIRVFYARHNSKTPFFIGLASVVVNVVLALYLAPRMGVAGLALAFSVASIVNFILLWVALRIDIGEIDELKILYSTIKFSIAGLISGLVIQGFYIPFTGIYVKGAKLLIWQFIDMTKLWGVLVQGLFAGLVGLAVYFLVCRILKSEELIYFYNALKRRLPWRKVETGDAGEARGI